MPADIAIRLGLKGGEEVEKTLKRLGSEGRASMKEIEVAAKGLPPHLVAVSRSVAVVKDQIDELHASTGRAGQILASFGSTGIAVAVGVAAVAAAGAGIIEQVKSAAEYADKIGDVAERVNVSAEALQEFRFAAREVGVEAGQADAALESFTAKFGAAGSGLSAKALKPFTALFGADARAEIKSWQGDVIKAYEAVADKIANLKDPAEQAAAAEKLGLEGVLPLLRKGAAAYREYGEEARKMGLIISNEAIAKGGEAAKKFEVLSNIISNNLKGALVDLAPTLVDIMKDITAFSVQAIKEIKYVVDNLVAYRELAKRDAFGLVGVLGKYGPGTDAAKDATPAKLVQADKDAIVFTKKQISETGPSPALLDQLREQKARLAASEAALDDDRRASAPVKSTGTGKLIDVTAGAAAAEGAKAAKEAAKEQRQAEREAAAEAKRAAEQRVKDEDLIAKVQGVDIQSARELAKTLQELDAARQHGTITTDAELKRLKDLATAREKEKLAAKDRALISEVYGDTAAEGEKLAETYRKLDEARKRGNISSDAELATLKDLAANRKRYDEQLAFETKLREEQDRIDKQYRDGIEKRRTAAEQVTLTYHPEIQRDADLEELRKQRDLVAGTDAAISAQDYDRALGAINQRYRDQKQAIDGVTLSQRLMQGALDGSIRSWSDLGRVALQVLNDIIQRAAQATLNGQGGGGAGGFFNNLLNIGGKALGLSLGGGDYNQIGADAITSAGDSFTSSFSAGDLPAIDAGAADGGDFGPGQTIMVGENGPEILRTGRTRGTILPNRFLPRLPNNYAGADPGTAALYAGASPRIIAAPAPPANISVHNYNGSQVQVTDTDDGAGGRDIRVDINEELNRRDRKQENRLFSGAVDHRFAQRFGVRPTLSGG